MCIRDRCNKRYINEREYIYNYFFQERLGLKYNISYNENICDKVVIELPNKEHIYIADILFKMCIRDRYNGVYYNYPPEQKYCTKLAYEKDVINELLEQIGTIDYFFQKFTPRFTNWLPYYWNNFKQTTAYTYSCLLYTSRCV